MTDNEYIEQFWTRLKLLCKQNSITEKELSQKLGLGAKFIENAKSYGATPKIYFIIESAKILNVTTDFLLTGKTTEFYQIKFNEIKQLSSL